MSDENLTPKQRYEKRKAERIERRARLEYEQTESEKQIADITDMMDRFVTAVERIADSMDSQ